MIHKEVGMSGLLKYFKRKVDCDGLPDPEGPLASELSPDTTRAVNGSIWLDEIKHNAKHGTYNKYSPKLCARIGKWATIHT